MDVLLTDLLIIYEPPWPGCLFVMFLTTIRPIHRLPTPPNITLVEMKMNTILASF